MSQGHREPLGPPELSSPAQRVAAKSASTAPLMNAQPSPFRPDDRVKSCIHAALWPTALCISSVILHLENKQLGACDHDSTAQGRRPLLWPAALYISFIVVLHREYTGARDHDSAAQGCRLSAPRGSPPGSCPAPGGNRPSPLSHWGDNSLSSCRSYSMSNRPSSSSAAAYMY